MKIVSALVFGLATLIWSTTPVVASELTVTVAGASHERYPPRIEYRNANSHFHVVLTNSTNKPLKIWDENYSWGYYSLSFRIKDSAGKEFAAKRAPTAFTKNGPVSLIIQPDGSYVLDIYFGDTRQWEGFEVPENGVESFVISAVFEINSTPESSKQQVWTGRVVSDPLTVDIARWKSK